MDKVRQNPATVNRTPTQALQTPTTGIPGLDQLFKKSPPEVSAAVYACLKANKISPGLCKRIMDYLLQTQIDMFAERTVPDGYDPECDALGALQWLAFADGLEAGSRAQITDRGSQKA